MNRIPQKHAVCAFLVCVIAVANLPAHAGAPCTTNGKSMRSLVASLQAHYSALIPSGHLAFNVMPHPNTPFKTVIVRHLYAGNTVFTIEASGISANEFKIFPHQQGETRAFAFRTVDLSQGYREVCLYEFYLHGGRVTVQTALAEGGPTKRTTAPQAQPTSAQLKPQWYGTWKSQDGKTTMTISASKMAVSELGKDDKGKPTRFTSDYRWVNTPSPSEAMNTSGGVNEFGYSKKRTSLNEIAKRFEKHYEADLKEYKKDPINFNFYDPTASRQAIAAITPGVYEAMWSQKDGEECVYDEYIVDGDRILQVQDSACNWVKLFNRVVSSQPPMTAPAEAAGAPASAPQTPAPVSESAKCSKSTFTDFLLAPWYKSTCDLIVVLRDPAGFQITEADASTDELFTWLRTGKNEDVIQSLVGSIGLGIAVGKFYHGNPWDYKGASRDYLIGIKKAGSTAISVLDPALKVLNAVSDAYFFASNFVSGVKTISGAFETYNAVAAYLTIGNERNMLIDYINTRCGAPSGEEPCSVNQAGTLLMAQALIKTGVWEETANQIICVKVKKWFSCKAGIASDQEKQALLNWLETEYQAYRLFRSAVIRQQIGKAIARVATGRVTVQTALAEGSPAKRSAALPAQTPASSAAAQPARPSTTTIVGQPGGPTAGGTTAPERQQRTPVSAPRPVVTGPDVKALAHPPAQMMQVDLCLLYKCGERSKAKKSLTVWVGLAQSRSETS